MLVLSKKLLVILGEICSLLPTWHLELALHLSAACWGVGPEGWLPGVNAGTANVAVCCSNWAAVHSKRGTPEAVWSSGQ